MTGTTATPNITLHYQFLVTNNRPRFRKYDETLKTHTGEIQPFMIQKGFRCEHTEEHRFIYDYYCNVPTETEALQIRKEVDQFLQNRELKIAHLFKCVQ